MAKEGLPFQPTTILNYGPTGSGKTTHLARLAKYIFRVSGGKIKDGKAVGGLRTRVYLSDNGSGRAVAEFDLLVAVGIIEVIDVRVLPHPFLWALKAAAGQVPLVSGVDDKTGILKGEWKKADNSQIGLFAYDSLTSIAERMFADLSAKSALGINIGGEGAYNFADGGDSWGKVMIGSPNRMHYNVVHQRIGLLVDHLGQLSSREEAIVYVTCMEDRGESETSKATIIGPKTVGKAMTDQLPRLFEMTFHNTLHPVPNDEPKRKMWLTTHQDPTAGNVVAMANWRGSKAQGQSIVLDPADLVQAIQMAQASRAKMLAEMEKEFA